MIYHSNFHQHQTLHKLRILYEYFRVQLLLSTKYCLIVTMMGVVLIHLKLIFLPFLTPVPSYLGLRLNCNRESADMISRQLGCGF